MILLDNLISTSKLWNESSMLLLHTTLLLLVLIHLVHNLDLKNLNTWANIIRLQRRQQNLNVVNYYNKTSLSRCVLLLYFYFNLN